MALAAGAKETCGGACGGDVRDTRDTFALAEYFDFGSVTVPVVRFTVQGKDIPPDALTHGSRGRPYTVVYDGYCKVCKRLVAALIKWDKRGVLEILPSQTPGLAARYPWIPAKAYLESVQFIENS